MTITRTLGTLAVLGTLSACGGSTDEPTGDTQPFVPALTSTADTAVESGPPIAGEVRIYAFFGWDETLGVVTKPDNYRSELVFEISIEDGSAEEDFCVIRVDLEGMLDNPAAQAEGWLFGLIVPEGDPIVEEDCTEKGFDFETNEMRSIEQWAAGPHTLMMGSTSPTDDVVTWLTDVLGESTEDLNKYVGGSVQLDGWEDANDDVYWYSYVVDDEGIPTDLDNDYVDRNDIFNTEGKLKTGYYNMRQTVFWFYY